MSGCAVSAAENMTDQRGEAYENDFGNVILSFFGTGPFGGNAGIFVCGALGRKSGIEAIFYDRRRIVPCVFWRFVCGCGSRVVTACSLHSGCHAGCFFSS